jgi:hypothetical protein
MAEMQFLDLLEKTESELKYAIFDTSLQKIKAKKDGDVIELIFDNSGVTLDLVIKLGVLFGTKNIEINPRTEGDSGCSCCNTIETFLIISFNNGQLNEGRLKEFVLQEVQRAVETYVEEGRTRAWVIPTYLQEYTNEIKEIFPSYEIKELKHKNGSTMIVSWEHYEKVREAIETSNAGGRA